MQVTITLDKELDEVLSLLMQERKTKNRSQVIRESVWALAEKILPKNATHGVFNDSIEKKKEDGQWQ